MPRRKPKPPEKTSEQVLRDLFPPEVRKEVREKARKAAEKEEKKATNDDPK
jgi:hypothetical protein